MWCVPSSATSHATLSGKCQSLPSSWHCVSCKCILKPVDVTSFTDTTTSFGPVYDGMPAMTTGLLYVCANLTSTHALCADPVMCASVGWFQNLNPGDTETQMGYDKFQASIAMVA